MQRVAAAVAVVAAVAAVVAAAAVVDSCLPQLMVLEELQHWP